MKNNILVIEDNIDDADLIKLLTQKKNIDVNLTLISNGTEAVKYIMSLKKSKNSSSTDFPLMVMLYLKLPDMSGVNVLQKIRSASHTKQIPITMFSSSNMQQDINLCYDNGANSYVRKPVDFHQFQDTIEQIINYWLHLNEY